MYIAGKSDIGLVRATNQDNYLIVENKDGDKLALVCDGIGGSNAGDVASLTVIKFVGHAFSNTEKFSSTISAKLWLEKVLRQANDELFSKVDNDENLSGMGTTLVGALFFATHTLIMNIGDSRAYTFKNDELKQVTTDHSLVNDLLKNGQISSDELETHPQRNVLTNALGVASNLKIDILEVNHYDKILLCSDGLSGYVPEEKISEILSNYASSEKIISELIKVSNEAGGYDNITVVLVERGELNNE